MSNKIENENNSLEEINKQIEDELLSYEHEEKEKKKLFLTIRFWIFFAILIILITKITMGILT